MARIYPCNDCKRSKPNRQASKAIYNLHTLAEKPVLRMWKSERLDTSKITIEDDPSRKQCERTEQASIAKTNHCKDCSENVFGSLAPTLARSTNISDIPISKNSCA